MRYFLLFISLSIGFSNQQFIQQPVDHRASEIQLSSSIPLHTSLSNYFIKGVSLDKGSKVIISIESVPGVNAQFHGELLTTLKKMRKKRKDITYEIRRTKSQLHITAKENLDDFKLSDLFNEKFHHILIKNAIIGKKIKIIIKFRNEIGDLEKDEIEWNIPISDNTMTLQNKDLLLPHSQGIIITTLKGNSNSNGYLLKGDVIKVDFATSQFHITPKKSNKLLTLDNCFITPHSAWYSTNAQNELREKAAEEVKRVLTKRKPRNQKKRQNKHRNLK